MNIYQQQLAMLTLVVGLLVGAVPAHAAPAATHHATGRHVPSAPTGLKINGSTVPRNGAVDLRWRASNSHGGGRVSYTVAWHGPTKGSKACGRGLTCLVTGLRNGRPYVFTVTARNSVGRSKPSAAVSATPDTQPSPVTAFAASQPGDGTLLLTWRPVAGNFSPVRDYVITWQGGTARLPASQRAYRPTHLNNDSIYTFTIVAQNLEADHRTVGTSPPALARGSLQTAGKPATPWAPSASISKDTATHQETVTLSGYGVDPNGPGPVTYTVTRRSSSGTSQQLVCSQPTAPTCTDSNLTLDGTTYSYTVVARNAETYNYAAHVSSPSQPVAVEVASPPDDFSDTPSLTPTGNNGEATLSFTAPPSNGKGSTITCTITGLGPCGGWTSTGFSTSGQTVSQVITGLTNGQAQTVTLQECNGSSGSAQTGNSCNSEVQSQAVTTYGAIGHPSVYAGADGPNVSWILSVDPNGRSATVTVVHDGQTSVYTTGSTAFSISGIDSVGYSSTDAISVTVSDGGRTSTSGAASATTAPPPSPGKEST